jgi:hypothetical protein
MLGAVFRFDQAGQAIHAQHAPFSADRKINLRQHAHPACVRGDFLSDDRTLPCEFAFTAHAFVAREMLGILLFAIVLGEVVIPLPTGAVFAKVGAKFLVAGHVER